MRAQRNLGRGRSDPDCAGSIRGDLRHTAERGRAHPLLTIAARRTSRFRRKESSLSFENKRESDEQRRLNRVWIGRPMTERSVFIRLWIGKIGQIPHGGIGQAS